MRKYARLESKLRKNIQKLLRVTKKDRHVVAVFAVDNRTMRSLNRRYRKKDKATNVLAFPAPKGFKTPPRTKKSLGEIYLAPEYIKTKKEDINYLLVHGFLHLLGFRHEKKNDTIRMQRKEKQLLNKL